MADFIFNTDDKTGSYVPTLWSTRKVERWYTGVLILASLPGPFCFLGVPGSYGNAFSKYLGKKKKIERTPEKQEKLVKNHITNNVLDALSGRNRIRVWKSFFFLSFAMSVCLRMSNTLIIKNSLAFE